ncbi:MAG: AAA family ATPase [Thermoplasmata archaeon]|nr:AAA family ATPase [Thermoplasmata archaeon]
MVVIIVSGLPGAGKEEFVKVMVENDFAVIRMGDIVREHVMGLGLQMNDVSIGGHANSEREKLGKDIWAVRTIEGLPDGDVVIDGCRSRYELEYFEKNLDNIITVGVEASREIRFKRLSQRGRGDDPKTFDDFVKREERELGWGLKEAMDNAQIKLNNDGGLEEFRQLTMSTLSAIRDRGPKAL